MLETARWIYVVIAALGVLGAVGFIVCFIWSEWKLQKKLKAEDDKWGRAMKQLRREAAERNKKEKNK